MLLFGFKVKGATIPALLLHILHHVIPEGHQTVLFTETKHHVEYLNLVMKLSNITTTIM